MKDVLLIILALAAAAGFIYGVHWVVKNVSYAIFYEDMVTETIREIVKKSALKVVPQ